MKNLLKLIDNSKLKDNIGIIILVPTILGGLWQIFELASLGIPFIRFFSVSQLVSDGLLLLFIISWTYLIWNLMISSFIRKEEDKLDEEESSIEQEQNSSGIFIKTSGKVYHKKDGYILISVMLAINIFIFYFALWPELIVPFLRREKLSIFSIIGITSGLTIMWGCLKFIIDIFFNINERKLNRDNPRVREFLAMIYIIASMFGIYYMINFLSLFHDSFMFPENLKNKKYIECKIKTNNPAANNYIIEYFNDKYIFISVTDNRKSKWTEVYKFEDFLDSSSCNELK